MNESPKEQTAAAETLQTTTDNSNHSDMATTIQKRSSPPGTVERLVREGADALRSGRVAEAQDLARNLLARHPRSPDALELFGITLLAQTEAEAVLIRGMAVAPAGQLSFALGTIFLERGDFEDASVSFARALAADCYRENPAANIPYAPLRTESRRPN